MYLLYLIFICILLVLLCVVKYVMTKDHDYWKKRKVPHKKPLMLFGNYKDTILMKKSPAIVTQDLCNWFPNEPYIGTFYGTAPALVIQDPELIKLVLATDFSYFNAREVNDYSHRETITKNIFFSGGDYWKVQRQHLTPLFSSAKIKGMFHLIVKCANQFEHLLEDEIKNSRCINVQALLAKYTIDCITSCAFGINSDTMRNDAVMNPFMIIREKIFESSIIRGIKMNCRQMWPALFYALRFSIFDDKLANFFRTLLAGVFKSRQDMKSTRNDFVDLLMSWKEKKVITGERFNYSNTDDRNEVSVEVSDDLIMAQCVGFFGAGFEPSTTTLSLALFEIAKKPDIQTKVLEEVDNYFKQNNGEIEYECINELPYISACIEETLRLYPVLGMLTREVMSDYTLPTGLHLEKGNRIHIPVYAIHRNPNFFPEPEVFRPERFYRKEKTFIKPFTFFPFGEGPRICIGLRFSKMPMHAGLLTIFKNYRVELADNMPHSVPFQPVTLVLCPASDINLKFIPRKG